MKRFPSIAVMLIAFVWAGSMRGQTLPTLENDYRNIFSQQGPPPAAPIVNGVNPTAHQFENGSAFGGFVPPAIQTGPGLKVVSSILGRPLVSAALSYRFGGVISPPLLKPNGETAPPGFYLEEPVHTYNGNTLADQFYWSPNAQKLYATQQGTVTVQWKETVSGAINIQTYQVSSAPDRPEKKIYWTEN